MRYGKKKYCQSLLSLLLALCMTCSLALGCTGCGAGGASVASMFLRKTEGTVAISDAGGADVALAENLGLYSGYTVGTEAESYAWIDLDKVKLAKLDADSAMSITKDGKNLSIDVTSGSLFFNVTEPLKGDETMVIATSSILVGIRGTCGWMEVPDNGTMRVYILEGKVECTAGGNTAMVNAGEMAEMTADGAIEIKAFDIFAVPDFVATELEADESLNGAVLEASGIDVVGSPLRAYGDFRAFLIRYDRANELVFADVIDFEADGSPELLALYLKKNEEDGQRLSGHIFRNGPNGIEEVIGPFGLLTLPSQPNLDPYAKVSLVEFGGRLFLMDYNSSGPSHEDHSYFGSIAQQDGDRSCWGYMDAVRNNNLDGSNDGNTFIMLYGKCPVDENGQRSGGLERTTAEEVAAVIAKYTEVRVLYEMGDGRRGE